jgi:hypothetical protein
MYRGSRFAASFLLVTTGLAATAAALFVVPPAVSRGVAWWLVPAGIAGAVLHFIALAGIARRRDWGRNLAVFVAELGGGFAFVGAIAIVVGARPFGADTGTGLGLMAWTAAMYVLLGIAAGRVPVVTPLTAIERQRAILGPSFAGIAR